MEESPDNSVAAVEASYMNGETELLKERTEYVCIGILCFVVGIAFLITDLFYWASSGASPLSPETPNYHLGNALIEGALCLIMIFALFLAVVFFVLYKKATTKLKAHRNTSAKELSYSKDWK